MVSTPIINIYYLYMMVKIMNPVFNNIYAAANKYNACLQGLRAIETAKDEEYYVSHKDFRTFAYWITIKEPELADIRRTYNDNIMSAMKKLDEIIAPSSNSLPEVIKAAWDEYNKAREDEMEQLISSVKEYYTK